MRRRYSEKERSDLIELVTTRGATVAEAAPRLGVTLSTAYKWMRDSGSVERGRRPSGRPSLTVPTFVRVLSSEQVGAGIVVRIGAAEIQIQHGFEAELLRAVVQALGSRSDAVSAARTAHCER